GSGKNGLYFTNGIFFGMADPFRATKKPPARRRRRRRRALVNTRRYVRRRVEARWRLAVIADHSTGRVPIRQGGAGSVRGTGAAVVPGRLAGGVAGRRRLRPGEDGAGPPLDALGPARTK